MHRTKEQEFAMSRSVALLTILLLCLTACAAGPNPLAAAPGADGEIAGFWFGLWHGVIAPFTFVGSLFLDDVSIYEVHNNGGWYNFGYLIGVALIFEGGTRTVVVYKDQNGNVVSRDG